MKEFITIFAILLCAALLAAQSAPTLPVDSRKIPMQIYRTYDFTEVAPTDTLWQKVPLPKGTVAVQFFSLVDSVAVRPDSTYAASIKQLYITKDKAYTLPYVRTSHIWIRRAAKSTAAKVRLFFYIM
ncbi:MAG: hypothetical protein PHC50_03360 [Candidatus Cloacimonetes bacterium]|nr:hypothetical protein [Candidatus Cloacimonadota bacterium]